jgi:hypothetical protein
VSSIYIWSVNSNPKSEVKMAEIGEVLDVSVPISIVFVCAVNMKLQARSVPKFHILTSI